MQYCILTCGLRPSLQRRSSAHSQDPPCRFNVGRVLVLNDPPVDSMLVECLFSIPPCQNLKRNTVRAADDRVRGVCLVPLASAALAGVRVRRHPPAEV